jgi:predicted lactoylglutathione lyase
VRRSAKLKGDNEVLNGAGALSKQEVGKMLSKALKIGSIRPFASPEFSHPFS